MTRSLASCQLGVAVLLLAACSATAGEPSVVGESIGATATTASTTTTTIVAPVSDVVDGAPMPADRCAANRDPGPVVFATPNGWAMDTTTVAVLSALADGSFAELCLDVTVTPSATAENFSLAAGAEASFAVAASYSELTDYAGRNDAEFAAVAVNGYNSLDALVITNPEFDSIDDLADATVAYDTTMPVAAAVMFANAGLFAPGPDPASPRLSFEPVSVAPFDPLVVAADTSVSAFTATVTDELIALDEFEPEPTVLRAVDAGVDGSFGVLYTTAAFVALRPSAAEDFVRVTQRAIQRLVDDPAAALSAAIDYATATSDDVVIDRQLEMKRLMLELNQPGFAPGATIDIDHLAAEIDLAVAAAVFDGPVVPTDGLVMPALLASVYRPDGQLIWPGT